LRIEDEAYCLMGMFGISMSIAYGEGKEAFYRLQAEIMRHSHDTTLFAWSGNSSIRNSMLAAGPPCFVPIESWTAQPENELDFPIPFMVTNYGLQIRLSICRVRLVVRDGSAAGAMDAPWKRCKMDVPNVDTPFEVMIPVETQLRTFTIANVGNSSDGRSIVVLLSSAAIRSRRYRRIPTKKLIIIAGPEWDDPQELFIL